MAEHTYQNRTLKRVGHTYGDLTVLGVAFKESRARYICECVCGDSFHTDASGFEDRALHCGCKGRIGKKYGKLTVLHQESCIILPGMHDNGIRQRIWA